MSPPSQTEQHVFDPSQLRHLDAEARRSLLAKELGLEQGLFKDYPLANAAFVTREQFLEVASAVYEGIRKKACVSTAEACRLINGGVLGSILYSHDDFAFARDTANKAAYAVFKDDAATLSSVADNAIDVSSFAALRDLTAQMHGQKYLNLTERNRFWDNKVIFSDMDLMKKVRIPGINTEQAFLLGVMTICGSVSVPQTDKQTTYETTISYRSGEDGDGPFIADVVVPLVRKSFNLPLKKDYRADRRVRINSQAVATFLRNGLSMSSALSERSLINFSLLDDEQLLADPHKLEQAYLSGIVSKKMIINVDKAGNYGTINTPRIGLSSQIQALARQHGFNFSLQSSGRLHIDNGQLERLLTESPRVSERFDALPHCGYMFNPLMIERVRAHYS